MHYRTDKHGEKLSILGFGCMRFQRKQAVLTLKRRSGKSCPPSTRGSTILTPPTSIPAAKSCWGRCWRKPLPGPG